MDDAVSSAEPAGPERSWPDDIYEVLRGARVRHVAYVPDAGHARLIRRAIEDPRIEATVLTTEEEGIGLLCGAWLGGERGALLMQSSGVGNCINALSLTRTCRFPLVMLVAMRGEWGEANPWQVPMGQAAPRALELAGVVVHRADQADEVAVALDAAARLAYQADSAAAVLIGQRVIGFKSFEE